MKLTKKEINKLELAAKEITENQFHTKPSGTPGTFVAFCYSHPEKLANPIRGAFSEDVLIAKIAEYIAQYNAREERLEAIQALEAHFSAPKKTRTVKAKTAIKAEAVEEVKELIISDAEIEAMKRFSRRIGGFNDRGYRGIGGAFQISAIGDAEENVPEISSVKDLEVYMNGEYQKITSQVKITCGKVFQPSDVWIDAEDALSFMAPDEVNRRRQQHGPSASGFYQKQKAKKYFYIDFLDIKEPKKLVLKKNR